MHRIPFRFSWSCVFFSLVLSILWKYSFKIFNSILDNKKRETKILFFNVGSSRFFFVSFYSSFIVHIRMVFDTAQHHFKSLTLVLTEITFVDVLYYVISSVVFFCLKSNFWLRDKCILCSLCVSVSYRLYLTDSRLSVFALRAYTDAPIKLMRRYLMFVAFT